MKKRSIYMDHAAATPVDKKVMSAMQPYFSEVFYNPSAIYLAARAVKQDIAKARSTVAVLLGAKPNEIIFTAGGTEANNIAINGVLQQHSNAESIIAATEHESVRQVTRRYKNKIAPVTSEGVDLKQLQKLISPKTTLISVAYANSETGTVQPLHEIATIVQKERIARKKAGNTLPLYFHTDASQAACYLDLNVHRLGVDMLTINGGKMYGPKQSGALYVKTGLILSPLIFGGGQESNVRSGTENVPAIMGLSTALQLARKDYKIESKRLQSLQKYFIDRLESIIPAATINGSIKHRLPNNIHITIPGIDNERILMELDERGIICATGSACSASSEEPSKALMAMGFGKSDIQSSLRFTMGKTTTMRDIDAVVKVLREIIE
jgi:cysteine desulfurase